jgi:hypothetical protein
MNRGQAREHVFGQVVTVTARGRSAVFARPSASLSLHGGMLAHDRFSINKLTIGSLLLEYTRPIP